MGTTIWTKDRVEEALKSINTVTLTHIDEVMALVADQNLDTRVNRYRSSCLYRGLPDASYALQTTLERNGKERYADTERPILRNFAKYAVLEEPMIQESVWRQLVIGQHHGLPTRLLDWSYSPLVALHFATSGENLEKMAEHDCVVWKIDIEEIHSLLPDMYIKILERERAFLFTVDMLEEVAKSLPNYDNDMKDTSLVLLEPPSIDQRIINQYSYFSVTPHQITCLEEFFAKYTTKTVRYIIDKDLRWRVRDTLDHTNLNERIMYPGLDGLTAWLKRHYYVK